jgi:hypothetical protein
MILGAGGRLICEFDLEDTELYSLKWYVNISSRFEKNLRENDNL